MREYDARQVVRTFLKANNETLVNVVNIMNANHPDDTETSQNLTNKLLRNTIRFSKVMEIADVLGYEICFKKKGSEEIESVPHKADEIPPEEPTTEKPHHASKSEVYDRVDSFIERINTPFTIIEGDRFRKILIIGNMCESAAGLLSKMVENNRKSSRTDFLNEYEILACAYVEASFDVIIYPSDCKEIGEK